MLSYTHFGVVQMFLFQNLGLNFDMVYICIEVSITQVYIYIYVCVCVCVTERERALYVSPELMIQ